MHVMLLDFHSQKIAEIFSAYEKKLLLNNALDFDDLLLLTIRLLQKNEEVRTKYQERFSYIMVDEYQDTNHVQYMLTKILSEKHHNICVVGDVDQSIYGHAVLIFRISSILRKTIPKQKLSN